MPVRDWGAPVVCSCEWPGATSWGGRRRRGAAGRPAGRTLAKQRWRAGEEKAGPGRLSGDGGTRGNAPRHRVQIRWARTPSAAPPQACHGAPRGARPRRAAVRLRGGDDGKGSSMMAPGETPPRSSKPSVQAGGPPLGDGRASGIRGAIGARQRSRRRREPVPPGRPSRGAAPAHSGTPPV